MSSRQLRKLRQQQELSQARDLKTHDESSGDEAPAVAEQPRVSLFAALGGEDDEPQDAEEEEDSPEDVKEEPAEAAQPGDAAEGQKKKKKKKKNKKKKKKKADNAEAAAAEGKAEEEDDIDKALKELNLNIERARASREAAAPVDDDDGDGEDADDILNMDNAATLSYSPRINEILSINPYYLKAVNEMRSLFGQDVIASAAAEDEAQRAGIRRHRRGAQQEQQVNLETFLSGTPRQKKLPEVTLRRNVFIQGQEHWPAATAGGLAMEEVRRAWDGSCAEYAYKHGKTYNAVEVLFFGYVQMGDPMRMVHLLRQVPYHVSTLLQVSNVAKQDQNMSLSAELCERALFTFGRVTTSAFRQDLRQGQARLDFFRPENRQFWLAGYRYLKSLIRKGTFRTALEWAKCLYSVNRYDPYAMRHFIHTLAIRAHESQWLVDFVNEVLAISKFHDTSYLRQSLVLAKLQLGDVAGARADLEAGMRQLPWLYCALFRALNLDTPMSIWGLYGQTNEREFWVNLYIYQAKDLWNSSQAIALLQEVAESIVRFDRTSMPQHEPEPGRDVTRLVYLEGEVSILALAPRELLETQPCYDFDPLPPPFEDNVISSIGTVLQWQQGPPGEDTGAATGTGAQERNMIARPVAPAAQGDGADPARQDGVRHRDLVGEMGAHAREGNGPGFLAGLIQMLRGDGGGGDQAEADVNQEEVEEQSGDEEQLPGAWPAERGG